MGNANLSKEEMEQFKALFSKYCRAEVDSGKCQADTCSYCTINNAYEKIFKNDDEADLPNTVTISLSELEYEEGDDLDDVIGDYLSDTYGFCHKGFECEVDNSSEIITVVNIDWDTEE